MPPRLLINLICISTSLQAIAPAAGEYTFEKDIRPIFRAHCYDCHGANSELEGQLDLRLVRFMRKGGESGPALIPGQVEKSLLIQRIRNGEMPPGQHRVPEKDIRVVEEWIAAGADTARPEPQTIGPGLGITPEERSFWSFQPIVRPDVPDLQSFAAATRVRTPVDALVLTTTPDHPGFAEDATRQALIKRVYFHLIGLPPSLEEMAKWQTDTRDDWYDHLISELLQSPHYGEQWARHWLDVAGYADSEGITNSDVDRPWAWKYRDWVIRAFNEDKPFDRFIIEQLAGDELAGPQSEDLSPNQIALLTATGFLRMAADGTGSGANSEEARNKVVADTLKILGTSLLGLSLQCAQCHDHRYDPIPQTDYYAIRAVFEPALDWRKWKVPGARRVSLYTAADREEAAAVEARTKAITAERNSVQAAFMKEALDKELEKYPEPLRNQLRVAYETKKAERSEEQTSLLAKHPSVNITPGNLYQYIAESKPKLAEYDKKIAAVRATKPAEEFLRALVEPVGHSPETRLFHRGDHKQPKQVIAPAALTLSAAEGQRVMFEQNSASVPSTGRRLAFATWLTSSQHPLLARVIVNRVWMHHFGKGIVETPSDFGKLGVPPTHPELLDWLASEFIQQGWSLKHLHRLILSSTVWRQSAELREASFESPVPLARRNLLRLEAETIRDRMLAASGQLDHTIYGKPVEIKQDDTGQVIVDKQTRRSLYVKARRSQPVAMLQAFDAPVMETNCERRTSSTVATQSLMLMNGEFTLAQAALLAERVAAESDPVPESLMQTIVDFPAPEAASWSYGFGYMDAETERTSAFRSLPYFTGSAWQGGPALPDSDLGWVLLTANGGHPDNSERAVIRRWAAPSQGTATLSGKLSHGSANGDGVRGRLISSRTGKLNEWIAHSNAIETSISNLEVEQGDILDLMVDCRSSYTSDSFSWPVTISLKHNDGTIQTFDSASAFRGPSETPAQIVGQIERAWQLALCRAPSPDELRSAADFAVRQIRIYRENGTALPANRSASRQAVIDVCHGLFLSNEFLYLE